ncbi:hypothetical protein ACUOA5_47150, partial [Escherichia coli]
MERSTPCSPADEGKPIDMLQYVQLDPKTLLTQFRDQVKKTDL